MTPETVIDIMREGLTLAVMIAGPILAVGLIAGVSVSIFQATTQINDQTMVTVPKILATLMALGFFGPWMLQMYLDFVRGILLRVPELVH